MELIVQQKRILIVDDNEAIHLDFHKILKINKKQNDNLNELHDKLFADPITSSVYASFPCFIIDSAYQGLEAVELVKKSIALQTPYALAFIDMLMPPGIDGVKTIEKLWAIDPHLQIVICTAYSEYSYEEMYQRLKGSDNFLILKKPFDIIEILQLVSSLTRKWDLEKQTRLQLKRQAAQINSFLTEMQSTQAQLLQHAKLISIGQLAAGVAHEINNPIAFIKSNIETLGQHIKKIQGVFKKLNTIFLSLDNAVQKNWQSLSKQKNLTFIVQDSEEIIRESLEGLERISTIVADLKSFSHTDEAEIQEANLHDCLDLTLKIIWNELKYKCQIIKDYGNIPLLQCYPRQLNQVFMNLLINACQAIATQGEIKISTRYKQGTIYISIQDNGEGIAPEHIEKLYDPFFTTKPIGTGTGLGLSISYNIIEKHGGKIEVQSQLGKGTTFTLILPLKGLVTCS